jgi:hypothetical protein
LAVYNSQHKIVGRNWYTTHIYLKSPITWSSNSCGIICFTFYILFC